MKHPIVYILLIIIGTSCNTPAPQEEVKINDSISTSVPENILDVAGCYMYVSGRDTILAILQQAGSEISGKLKFDNYQIDGSSGSLKGVVDGDILKLKYDFYSEGMNSIMDIFFKYSGDSLIRGVGEMETKGDSAIFINTNSITFPNETVLIKTNCDLVKF